MKTVILAGGFGTRLQEETTVKPKPMVEIGGRPMLWHIMSIYATADIKEFYVALGYKGEVIKSYFHNYFHMHGDFTINLASGDIRDHDSRRTDWIVHLIDTGLNTQTGGRLHRLRNHLAAETFMMTYGDGVCNVNLGDLFAFHKKHGKLATLTAVRPPARFGGIVFDGDRVAQFVEKPQIGEGWINGGYMVLEPGVLDYIDDDTIVFEREPMERLAADGQLMAYRHEGFWQCMDTLRDVELLNRLWQAGAPWSTIPG